MSNDKTTTVATSVSVPSFVLEAPEVITPIAVQASQTAVPLKPEVKAAVDDQVARFVDALLKEDVHTDAFKSKLDSAFALGKEEVSTAASLMQGRFMQRNMVGVETSPAFKAMGDIRSQLDELNPGKDGDLLQPNKLLGIIPFGNKLQAYFRKFESAGDQLKKAMTQLYAARDEVQMDIADIDRKSTRLNSSHRNTSRMPSSA